MHYTHLNLDINYNLLRFQADFAPFKPLRIKKEDAQDTFFEYAPTWQFGRIDEPIGHMKDLYDYFKELFDDRILINYLRQDANTEVPMHADSGTICAVNIIVSDNAAPITFENIGDVEYKCALINTQQRHMVKPFPEDRYLLKYSMKSKTYEECYAKLPDSLKLSSG